MTPDDYRLEIAATEEQRDRVRCKLLRLRGEPGSGAAQRAALEEIERHEKRLRYLTDRFSDLLRADSLLGR